ncbi:MAG TPA: GHKL domain-containing protein [Bacteroidetes bacterium]|nr:GHKL domain-containing protein [Bacteroidota bacterium]
MDNSRHPFLVSRKNILLYASTWILLAGVHVMLLLWRGDFPLYVTINEALISTFFLALLGLALWYPVRFMDTGRNHLLFILAGYGMSGAVMLLLWLTLTHFFLRNFFPGIQGYHVYLNESVGWKVVGGALVYLIILLVYYLTMTWHRLREKDRQEARLETLIKESELKMLRSQINPHFLFNSLNSISALTLTDPGKARDMVVRLSEFFRYSLDHKMEDESTLEEELHHIENYLAMEQVRFGERLVFTREIPGRCIKMKLPNLILQPLFENAVKHGVYQSTEQVEIRLTARCDENRLRLMLSNHYDPDVPAAGRRGIGLSNIAQRLELKYGQEGLMGIEKDERIFTVTLLIPQSS